MYSAIELKNLTAKPRINDISLKILSQYYEIFLNPFIYYYSVKNNHSQKNIELRFDTDNFCHLLGIEAVAKHAVPFKELHNYRGNDGWDSIVNEKLTVSDLKKYNKKKFQSVKAKYVYFYLVPNLIQKPLAVSYIKEKVEAPTKIDCEILFYSDVQGDNAIIHLGISYDGKRGYYIPRTFFAEKVSQKDEDVYISGKEEIEVEVLKRVILQTDKISG